MMDDTDERSRRRPPRQRVEVDANAPEAADYREAFRTRGSATLFATELTETRRVASWAPYVCIPLALMLSKRVPQEYRIRAWTASLVAFGFSSILMYNTDGLVEDDW